LIGWLSLLKGTPGAAERVDQVDSRLLFQQYLVDHLVVPGRKEQLEANHGEQEGHDPHADRRWGAAVHRHRPEDREKGQEADDANDAVH
jgi:hypothetical protein